MGRLPWSNRATVERCYRISISKMNKDGVMKSGPGHTWSWKWLDFQGREKGSISYSVLTGLGGELCLQFSYAYTASGSTNTEYLKYQVELAAVKCHFGGKRYWFICPLERNGHPCRRRAGKLYIPPGAKYFGCRHCYDLTYRSQKEHNKSVDKFLKNPALFLAGPEQSGLTTALLALKAGRRLQQIKTL
jgi:hypothetical protein